MEEKKYINLILSTNIAEYSNIKGLIILKPYGYKIWDNIKNKLNKILIKKDYNNVYFPLLINKSLLKIEYKYFKKIPKQCAIITHSKFKINKYNNLIIDKFSKLNEELIIRPTSEIIIWNTFKKWIESYKDLPILINQWCNIIRLEMKNKFFLRNSEFLWVEGHTVHINKNKALKEINKIKKMFKFFLKKYLSIPFISGYKSKKETFETAKFTYTFETLTKDKGKSIQLATIHFLYNNYSKALNVKFTNRIGKKKYCYGTSWGLSTRLIGTIIMIHNDKNGLILPPKIAPIQIIIIPLIKKKNIYKIIKILKKKLINNNIKFKLDNNFNIRPGKKFYKYDNMGIPIKIIIGKYELKNKKILLIRRDTFKKYYFKINNNLNKKILNLFKKIQDNIYKIAKKNMKKKIFFIKSYKIFKEIINKKNGFIITNWKNNIKNEFNIQKKTKATIRCILKKKKIGKCLYSKKLTKNLVIFGKSY
ncbi:MAG: His/Gly/Thr/Pro-type tRNA ligase C-terminal domain-containing protein [Candidatus Shikimatogenerans sp. JK-2022]|nr:His/Gly/Thr/Pro-type tRNA ligase C-terminal domain-containing protein [Candidatus Shikimatogenerans bostrichidophilus]